MDLHRIVREDELRFTFRSLRDYLRQLQLILKHTPYHHAEIDTIQCYLLQGVYADLAGGMFHVFFDNGVGRIKIGIVTKSRKFVDEIYQSYRTAVQ